MRYVNDPESDACFDDLAYGLRRVLPRPEACRYAEPDDLGASVHPVGNAMIPVAALVELVPLIIGTVRLIRGLLPDEEQQQLIVWANLLKDKPTQGESAKGWQRDVGQFLVNLTTRRGYSPAYQYEQQLDVPDDLLTDLVDLLVGGWSAGSKWNVRAMLRDPLKDRQAWQETIATGKDAVILAEAEEWLAKRGRSRAYSPTPATRVDRDWFADSISYLIG